jgi:hypothetical protein
MRGYHLHQPLNRRGITLLELTVGIALAGVVGLVSAGLFKAGIKSYNYSYRQTRIISSARKAMAGDGPRLGMTLATLNASAVDALAVSSLTVTPAGDFSTTFLLSDGGLYRHRLATRSLQAESVTGLQVAYYNLDAAGRIMVSTSAASAAYVTTQIELKGARPGDKTYNFAAGALVRNK